MSSYIKVNNFEIEYIQVENRIDLFILKFIFNKNNIISFGYFKSNYKNLINIFDSIINGNKGLLELDINTKNITGNYFVLNFDKDFLNFKRCINNYDISTKYLPGEFLDIYFENNSIVRNSLREFIDKFEIPSEIEIEFLQKNIYYNGIYFPRIDTIPSKDEETFYIEDEKIVSDCLSLEKYREKFGVKHDTLENVYIFHKDFEDLYLQKDFEDLYLQRKYLNIWKNKPDELNRYTDENELKEKYIDENNSHLLNNIKNILQNIKTNDFSFIVSEINNKLSIHTDFEDLPYILKDDFEILYDIVENEDQLIFEELRKLKLGKKSLKLLHVLNNLYTNCHNVNNFFKCRKIGEIIVSIRENCIKFENIPEKDFYSDIVTYLVEYNKDTNYIDKECMDILFDLEITKLINTSNIGTEKSEEEYSCYEYDN